VEVPKQTQDKLPGLDKQMVIPAEHSKVECWDENGKPYLKEYVGSEKLKGKKAIITGGDSVSCLDWPCVFAFPRVSTDAWQGIGRTVTIFFAREGADVTVVHLPEEEEE
jgi:hypothetical protein